MGSNSLYYKAEDVMGILQVSRTAAYRIIRDMNAELGKKGYLVIPGRVPKAFFAEHFYGMIN